MLPGRPGAVLRVPVPQRSAAPGRATCCWRSRWWCGTRNVRRGGSCPSSRSGSTCTARGSTAWSCWSCSGWPGRSTTAGCAARDLWAVGASVVGLVLGGALYPRAFEILLLPTRQFGDPVEREALQAYREWARVSFDQPMLWALLALGVVALFGAVRQRRWGSAGVVVLMVLMGWSGARLVPIAAVSLVPFAAAAMRHVGTLSLPTGAAVRRCWTVTAVILAVTVAYCVVVPSYRMDRYPVEAVDWLESRDLVGGRCPGAVPRLRRQLPGVALRHRRERVRGRSTRCRDAGAVPPDPATRGRVAGRARIGRSRRSCCGAATSPLTAELADDPASGSRPPSSATTPCSVGPTWPTAAAERSVGPSAGPDRPGRRSGEAQSRRQVSCSGPRSDGVARGVRPPSGGPPVGGGLVGQLGDADLDPDRQRAGVLALGGAQRRAEGDRDRWPGRAAWRPCGSTRPVPSRWTGTTGTPQRTRQVGGAALERLAPAVGAAAALGEDQQRPAVVEQLGGPVGGVAG